MDTHKHKQKIDGNITLTIRTLFSKKYIVINTFPTENFNDSKLKNIGKVKIRLFNNKNEQILIPDTKFDNCYFGYDIDIDVDNGILVIGCPGRSLEDGKRTVNGVGCVYIYKLINDNYCLRDVVIPSIITPNLFFGSSVKLNNNILTIGCLSLGLSIDSNSEECRTETINLDKLTIYSYQSKFKSQLKYRKLCLI